MPRKEYDGVLRCRIKIVSPEQIRVDWFDEETREVIWSEAIKVPSEGMSAVSQIKCSGTFETTNGYFMDEFGLKHHRMTAEPGKMVSQF